ncbi:MAG: phosphatase PAP2 family protein [Alphaproteobacteria bacterium]|nr:phosphatase PAP2 family protein [Alphaproteobacteria bacterium]
MFLTSDNKIKWNLIGFSAMGGMLTIIAGVCWFDYPVFLFVRNLNCILWEYFGYIFDAKIWLLITGILIFVIYAKKTVKSFNNVLNFVKEFKIKSIFIDFIEKTKRSYAFFIFCSVFMASIITVVLKAVIGRARPVFFEALDMIGFYPMSTEWAYNSMPSGHAAASFAGLVMLGLLVPKLKPVTWTVAIVVAVSRVAVGAHWPTDVLFGAFIGMICADFVMAYLKHFEHKK